MNENVFREPVQTVEREPEVFTGSIPDDGSPVDTPPSIRQELNKSPLLLEVLKSPPNFMKHFNMKSLVNDIDGFINEEISRSHLKDDKETYSKIADKYFSQVKDKGVYDQVESVHKLIQIERTLLQAIKERKDLLEGDPLKLSSEQLLKRLKLQGVSHV
jgi:hypothetical protein